MEALRPYPFLKAARMLKQSPWNMSIADDWLTALVDANKNGFSPAWVPPTILRVLFGNHVTCSQAGIELSQRTSPSTPPGGFAGMSVP